MQPLSTPGDFSHSSLLSLAVWQQVKKNPGNEAETHEGGDCAAKDPKKILKVQHLNKWYQISPRELFKSWLIKIQSIISEKT